MVGSDHDYDNPMAKSGAKPVTKVVTDEVKCFIAIARGAGTISNSQFSGVKVSEEEAVKWAVDFLNRNGQASHVNIAKIYGRVERKTVPVEFKLLPNSLED